MLSFILIILLRTVSSSESESALKLLVGDVPTFFNTYWDNKPGHFHSDDPTSIETLLSPSRLYDTLQSNIQVCKSIELVKKDRTMGGGPDHQGNYINSDSDTCDFATFDQSTLERTGATILLPSADRIWQDLSELACDIQGELGHPININTYLSPPSATGFLMHRDGHDLLIVQTYGTKKWQICEPRAMTDVDRLSIHGKHFGEGWVVPKDKYKCYVKNLVVGDVLYLPRGTLHTPTTGNAIGSMHLSIGVDVRGFRWVDVVTAHLRESQLLERLSREAMKHTPATTRDVTMMAEAFIHPITGDWVWSTLFGAYARMLPDISSALGLLTRAAFPMHRLAEWGEDESIMLGKEGGEKYVEMIELMAKDCTDMMSSAVQQFHSEIGDPPGSVKADKEAKHVGEKCAAVVLEAFPSSSFRFLAGNMMHAGQRLWERKCVLGNVQGSDGKLPMPTMTEKNEL